MVFGGRPLAVPRYSGTIKCDDLPQLGLKVSILIDLLAWIGWSAVLRIGEGMSDATTAIDPSPDHRAARSAHGST
jgi:hypothetical protein